MEPPLNWLPPPDGIDVSKGFVERYSLSYWKAMGILLNRSFFSDEKVMDAAKTVLANEKMCPGVLVNIAAQKMKEMGVNLRDLMADAVAAGATRHADIDAVRRWAEAGHPKSQYAIGRLYESGCHEPGVDYDKDLAKAAEWYRKAAEQGDAKASLALLGLPTCHGRGVPQDHGRAKHWTWPAPEHERPEEKRDIVNFKEFQDQLKDSKEIEEVRKTIEEERKKREAVEKKKQSEDVEQKARRLEIMRRANIECLRESERFRLSDEQGEPVAPLKFIITAIMVLVAILFMKACSR